MFKEPGPFWLPWLRYTRPTSVEMSDTEFSPMCGERFELAEYVMGHKVEAGGLN